MCLIFDWAQHKLGDIAQRKNKTSDCSKLPNVSYEDISPNIGTLNKSVNKLSTGKKGILFKKDDVLFGKLRPYLNNYLFAGFTGIAIGDFWVLNHKEAPQFLFYLIQSPKFRYISNISSGSKMPRSDWNLVSNYKFNVPAVFEQTNIGKTLKLIDTLITLQQRKAQQLKLLKKAMLQDIFPNTQGIRQIKLSNNIWVEKRIVDIFKEKNIRSKNGELLSVSISKGIYPFSNSERKNNSSIDKSNYKKVTPGDIAYNSMRMWQGALGVSKYNGIVSPAYTVMATRDCKIVCVRMNDSLNLFL
ncbi:restriction endonuclease subunit S [Lactobacillus crispatus]|uniref:restriction endonuclease subunit S n=1 Tax=Lactobacillus crispatus TaxID=47770 RepID=UPI0018EF2A73